MAKKNKNKKNKAGKRIIGFQGLLLLFCAVLFTIMFLPTAFLITVGMLPTFVCAIVDNELGKNKTFTIGAMNFAGCFPYLLGVWMESNSMNHAMNYIIDPVTIITMYGAAGLGYIINWVVTMSVSSILVQRSKFRINRIKEEQSTLETRWGEKVNGKYKLDENGFPLNQESAHQTE